MIRFAPDDGGFAAAFRVASVSKGTAARYLLREIEYNRRPRGGEVQINDLPSVSLEHIYPQNPIAGTWANHERWVHRLGNLTIMSRRLNSGLRNGAFAAKKAVYGQSDILITRELDAENSWNQAAVDRRQDRMLADANVIWRFI
jgi:Protein of unknown function (DUF1524)